MRGLGVDVASLERLREIAGRHRERFVARCFRPGECDPDDVADLAACWAVKEAFVKAVGAGGEHVPYRDVELDRSGVEPRLRLHGRAAELAGDGASRVALTRRGDAAVAVVVLL